jgi:hypothetical protein
VSKPPPADLNDWGKHALVKEVERLRAVLREFAERPGDDAREASTSDPILGESNPYAQRDVLLDARSAVLMDGIDIAMVDGKGGETASLFMVLEGRINYSENRVKVAWMFGPDGAAGLVSELLGIADRARGGDAKMRRYAAEFRDDLDRRIKELP